MLQWLFGSCEVVTVDQDFKDRVCRDMIRMAEINQQFCDMLDKLNARLARVEQARLKELEERLAKIKASE